MLLFARMLTLTIAIASAATAWALAQDKPEQSVLSEPKVVMEANPPPPFTYWAQENSSIRNHPRDPLIWIAESEDGSRLYYFGDQCRASEFQRFVGQSLDALPDKPAGATWRTACSSCAVTDDLHRKRMNVFYDDGSRTITTISCG